MLSGTSGQGFLIATRQSLFAGFSPEPGSAGRNRLSIQGLNSASMTANNPCTVAMLEDRYVTMD